MARRFNIGDRVVIKIPDNVSTYQDNVVSL